MGCNVLRIIILLLSLILYTSSSWALLFQMPRNGDDVFGEVQLIHVRQGDTLSVIARRFDMGYYELLEANPGINPRKLRVGQELIIPTQFVLPNVKHEGIIINQAEMRLYYFIPNINKIMTVPVGIGRVGWRTPVGMLRIVEKIVHPDWHVPKSIKAARARHGVFLPDVVPAGPNNPLGDYAMRLSLRNYLLHGTNDPAGIGRRVSAGCIRLYPEDIKNLFSRVPVNTPVRIINEPFKIGWLNGKIYMEAHEPLRETAAKFNNNVTSVVTGLLNKVGASKEGVSWNAVHHIARKHTGLPMAISK